MTGATAKFEDRSLPPLVLPADVEVAVPLREAHAAERILRYVLAVLLTAYLGFAVYEGVRRPTIVDGGSSVYGALMSAANAGELERVDDTRDGYVLWQRADGAVFAERRVDLGIDVRASVEAQPHVRGNPGSVRFGRIDAPPVERHPWRGMAESLGALLLFGMLAAAPAQPRHATRWAWFWIGLTGVGAVAYLLLSGSHTRTSPQRPDAYWGAHGLLVLVGFGIALATLRQAALPDAPRGWRAPGTVDLVRTTGP